jgi:ABC-type nitrate/sulfonate/bicarbonate transport system substrate-binding protein
VAVLTVLCALLLGAPASGAAPPHMRLVLATPAHSVLGLPERVAVALGFFEKYGLDVTLLPETDDLSGVAALELGRADIVNGRTIEVLLANAGGEDLEEIASNGAEGYLVVSRVPARALAGGRFAIRHPFDTDMAAAVMALRRLGADPTTIVWVVPAGDPGQRIRAVAAGAADATVIPPFAIAPRVLDALGLKVIYDARAGGVPFVTRNYLTRAPYYGQHPDEIRAFLQGLMEANAYLLGRKNEAAVMALLEDPATTHLDTAHARRAYDDLTQRVIRRVPAADREGLEMLLGVGRSFASGGWWFDPRLSAYHLNQYIREDILRALAAAGFPRRMCLLYGCP